MLQRIHDKVSGIFAWFLLGLLAVVFIFWGIDFGFSGMDYAAKVKSDGQAWWAPSTKIGTSQVREAWQNQLGQFQQMYRGEVPEQLKASLQGRLLEEFVRNEVLTQHTTNLGYRVSDDEVMKSYESIPAFQIDGKFSRDTAQYRLQSQGLTPAAFEAEQRKFLQLAQLQEAIAQSSFVTPTELATFQRLQGEQREASWLVIPAAKFAETIKPDDAEIKKHYDEHLDQYMTPETVVLRYVELKVADLANDVQVTPEALQAHYESIKDRYMDDKGTQKSFDTVRPEVEADFRNQEAEKRFGELQEKLSDQAVESLNDLDAVAQAVGFKIQEIPDFRRDIGGGALIGQAAVAEAAFSEQVLADENSRPIEVAPGHILVVRASGHKPAEARPLAEVRDDIVATLKREKSEQQARELARRSAALMQAGGEKLDRLASEFKTQPQGPKFVGRTDQELPAEVRAVLFATPRPDPGKPLYRPVSMNNGDAAILKFSGVRQEDAAKAAEEAKIHTAQLSQSLAQSELGAYITDVRRAADVSVNPKVFD